MKKVFLIGLMGLSLAQGAANNKALMAKAFPSGWPTCKKENGKIDFASVVELEKTEDGKKLVDAKVASILKDCPFAKNANFSAAVQTACQSAVSLVSTAKNKLCGGGATQGAPDNKALMKKAFPSGWPTCKKENGKIDFASVVELEKTEDGKKLVDAKVASILKDCPFAKNANFSAAVQTACQSAVSLVSPAKNKLCGGGGALGVPDNKALMAKAFPSGWPTCKKENGKIDFASVVELEKTEDGKKLVDAKVASILKDCPFAKNANFSAAVQTACQSAVSLVSTNKDKLCGTTSATDSNAQPVIGTVIDPSAPTTVTGTVVDIKALMAKAFPSGWPACKKENGNVDFVSVAELEKTEDGKKLVDAKVASILKDCPFAKNANFSASMQTACQSVTSLVSPAKDKLCGTNPINGNDSTALLKKAFPEPAFSMACSEGRGALDFTAMALVETSNPNALEPKKKGIIDCANDAKKNPNFIKTLTNGCKASSPDSFAKSEICKSVGIGSDVPIVAAPTPDTPPVQLASSAQIQPVTPEPVDKAELEAVIIEMQTKIANSEAETANLKAQLEVNGKYIRDQVMPYMKSIYDFLVGMQKDMQTIQNIVQPK